MRKTRILNWIYFLLYYYYDFYNKYIYYYNFTIYIRSYLFLSQVWIITLNYYFLTWILIFQTKNHAGSKQDHARSFCQNAISRRSNCRHIVSQVCSRPGFFSSYFLPILQTKSKLFNYHTKLVQQIKVFQQIKTVQQIKLELLNVIQFKDQTGFYLFAKHDNNPS